MPFGIQPGTISYSDAAATLTAGISASTAFFGTTLTADRAVTSAGGFQGAKFRIARPAGGAFNLKVGTGSLAAFATNQWVEIEHDG
ncbi:MAG: hypothetical protein AB1781_03225 [Pseudomonadota bacterium]